MQIESPLGAAELVRRQAWLDLETESKAEFGQFFTPAPLARLLAQRIEFQHDSGPLRILDPGAGVGSLGVAVLERLMQEGAGGPVHLTAVEIDPLVAQQLRQVRERTLGWASEVGLGLTFEVVEGDFVDWASERLGLFGDRAPYDVVIMNPPYKKVSTRSRHRRLTAEVGCEVTNLYAAFVALGLTTLRQDGQLVAITPRSFTNGPYFRPFRKFISERSAFRTVDLFESRSTLFADSDVLQENVVYSLVCGGDSEGEVELSFHGADGSVDTATAHHSELMPPADDELFIFLRNGQRDTATARVVNSLPCRLADLGLEVSTGKVVAFRSREYLRDDPGEGCVPILYPPHLRGGSVSWPLAGEKPSAIALNERTRSMLLPAETFVAVKRFTSKEERRRVVPTLVDGRALGSEQIAFENHLNVVHSQGRGLSRDLAVGVTLYLRSTILDDYFRQFSGHTQVNATDLRTLPFPDAPTLRSLARGIDSPAELDQASVDRLVREAIA